MAIWYVGNFLKSDFSSLFTFIICRKWTFTVANYTMQIHFCLQITLHHLSLVFKKTKKPLPF